jgi:hypothetical protein
MQASKRRRHLAIGVNVHNDFERPRFYLAGNRIAAMVKVNTTPAITEHEAYTLVATFQVGLYGLLES